MLLSWFRPGACSLDESDVLSMQAGVGHYGVFSGKSWQQQIYPMVKNIILQSD
jgi:poly-beta-hydroxyalkanoate depolymerase